MTMCECIAQLDSLMHNTYSDHQKKAWLRTVDSMLRALVLRSAAPAVDGAEDDPALLAQPPFDAMYLHYLQAQIHYHNGEYDRYNNAISMFQSCFDSYRSHHSRTQLPPAVKLRYF